MKGFGDINRMLKTAKEMQERMQRELAELRVEGSGGGGMVVVVLDGQKNLLSLKVDPEVVNRDEVDMLQDLILAAFRDAAAKVDAELAQKLGGLGAGLKIPGLF
jgi:DNA-binding YbaB/EbfC family protein